MKYVCDAPDGKTWFQIVTEAEAAQESALMHHAVEKFFRQEKERATASYQPASKTFIEQEIGLKAHLLQEMPIFLTLRDGDGNALATAMLPPLGRDEHNFRSIIVSFENSDPYAQHGEAVRALGRHFGRTLDRDRCYPYRRD